MTPQNVLGIFAKQPEAGKVKTRLGAEIGAVRAATLYETFLKTLQKRLQGQGDQRWFCYAPSTAEAATCFKNLAGQHYQICPQVAGELGERLQAFFTERFAAGAKRVLVIGSDSPTLPVELIETAFEKLNQYDSVLGPATDGGYFLIGFSKQAKPVFEGINWSTADVLYETVQKLKASGSRFAILDQVWYDVDNLEGLHLLRGHLAGLAPPLENGLAELDQVVNMLISGQDPGNQEGKS